MYQRDCRWIDFREILYWRLFRNICRENSHLVDIRQIFGALNMKTLDFSKYQLNAQFFYFSTIYMLHYAPLHVSSSTLLIIRRANCITKASGIVTLCKQPYSTRVESSPPAYCRAAYRGWRYQRLWWYNWSSWWWAACCSKHVEERSVTYILLTIKRIVH